MPQTRRSFTLLAWCAFHLVISNRPRTISLPFTCRKDELAPKALEHLQTIYKTLDPKARGDFDSFVARAAESKQKGSDQPVPGTPSVE